VEDPAVAREEVETVEDLVDLVVAGVAAVLVLAVAVLLAVTLGPAVRAILATTATP
jgi:hypothetical protein